jgi:hypothetical protein
MRRRDLLLTSVVYGAAAGVRWPLARAQTPTHTTGAGINISRRQIQRIIEGLRACGESLPDDHSQSTIERILSDYTLLKVQLDDQGLGKAALGDARRELVELGWRTFLVRVENPGRLTGPLILVTPSAVAWPAVIAEGELASGIHDSHILGNDGTSTLDSVPDADSDFDSTPAQWMGYRFGAGTLQDPGLEGLPLEYLILQIYSQAGGSNTASLAVCSAALPFIRRAESKGPSATFVCSPASTVVLDIRDSDGRGTTASLLIRDRVRRLYPAPAHRLEPDLGYQRQIYRAAGECIGLPAGRFEISASRGPEYLPCERCLAIGGDGKPARLALDLRRWIDPPSLGWYPGDPHLHAEGQAFGIVSKLGLTPETLVRQVRGEALSVGSVLVWSGGYYYEKRFLTGHVYSPTYQLPFPEVQRANNTRLTPAATPHDSDSLVRYDVEHAGFPSNRHGHPILLRLKSHDYRPGGGVYGWPSWNLPVLQWARQQDAVVGYAHIGHSLAVTSAELPNFEIPAFEGIGGNECLVDVAHGAVDFVAGGENQPVTDLNLWYHLLDCGFAVPMVGETDFPVGARTRRVGTVRTYVGLKAPPSGDGGYEAWTEGIRSGRLYFGDGRSHVIDFQANDRPVGTGPLDLPKGGKVTLRARVAAWLDPTPHDPGRGSTEPGYAYWHIEHARIGASRNVALEVVVNAQSVERLEVLADGALRPVSIDVDVPRSSWVALRILPSAHTAPITISIAGQPVRASRRSAQWCLDGVNALWDRHARLIRAAERPEAARAWEHARGVYRAILEECSVD